MQNPRQSLAGQGGRSERVGFEPVPSNEKLYPAYYHRYARRHYRRGYRRGLSRVWLRLPPILWLWLPPTLLRLWLPTLWLALLEHWQSAPRLAEARQSCEREAGLLCIGSVRLHKPQPTRHHGQDRRTTNLEGLATPPANRASALRLRSPAK